MPGPLWREGVAQLPRSADCRGPTPGAGGSLNGAAAYAFELTNNGTWVETAKMIAPNADVADFSSFHALSPGGDGTVALATGVRDAASNVARRIFIY